MAALAWTGTPGKPFGGYDGSGVHLTNDSRVTLCGRRVLGIPEVPRSIEPLSCRECYALAYPRKRTKGTARS